MDDLSDPADPAERERTGTKISVKKSTSELGEEDALPETVTTPPHIPNMNFPRGIDHSGAINHWAIFLFFFVIGILLYTSWSFNARLNQLETRTMAEEVQDESQHRVEDLLLKLIEEVRLLRTDLSSQQSSLSSSSREEL